MNTPASTASAISDEQRTRFNHLKDAHKHMLPLDGTSIRGRDLHALLDIALAAPTAQPVGQDWTKPTKYLQRLGDAIALLCGGKRPSDEIISAWLDAEADDLRLQDFAATHGPSWGQGIGVIDAAMTLADQPTEGVAHEFRAAVEPSQPAPVAYVNSDELDNMLDDRTATIQSAPSGWRRTALYRASTPPAPAAPSPWQSIDSAPKDGTWLLLWEQYSDNPFIGCWMFGRWTVSHEHVDAEGGWNGAIVVDNLSMPVTHWMPLPDYPAALAASTKGEAS